MQLIRGTYRVLAEVDSMDWDAWYAQIAGPGQPVIRRAYGAYMPVLKVIDSLHPYDVPRVYRLDRRTGLLVVFLRSIYGPPRVAANMWPALLQWGRLYPFDWQRPDGEVETYAKPASLGDNPVARRSAYMHGLYELKQRAQGLPSELGILDWEQQTWLRYDAERTARIWQNIEPLMLDPVERFKRKDEHWLWEGLLTAGKPVLSFDGAKNIPVARFLWTTERPEHSLVDKRPRRDKAMCISQMCVNPHHFELAKPTRVGRSLTGTAAGNYSSTGDHMPPRNFYWNINSRWVPDPDGVFSQLVVCRAGHPLGNAAQIAYNRALKGGSPTSGAGHCPKCYQFRRKHGLNVPLRPYKGQPVDQNLIQTAREWFKDAPLYPGPQPEPEPEADPFEAFSEGRSEPGFNVHGPYDVDEIEDLFKDMGDNNPA